MPKLSPVSWKELVNRLRKLGFEGPYQGGKHPFMVRGDIALAIPNAPRGVIGVDLLQRILKRANIRRDEWLETK